MAANPKEADPTNEKLRKRSTKLSKIPFLQATPCDWRDNQHQVRGRGRGRRGFARLGELTVRIHEPLLPLERA